MPRIMFARDELGLVHPTLANFRATKESQLALAYYNGFYAEEMNPQACYELNHAIPSPEVVDQQGAYMFTVSYGQPVGNHLLSHAERLPDAFVPEAMFNVRFAPKKCKRG